MRRLTVCIFTFLLFVICAKTSHAQQCCVPEIPTGESTTFIGPGTGPNEITTSQFEQVLAGSNFSGWQILEQSGGPGADGCWNPQVDPGYVPEYPVISGGQWPIGADNSWGPDEVGWVTGSVDYIRGNSPLYSNTPIITVFPCGAEVYQVVTILCIEGVFTVPFDDVIQTETVYDTYVQNCREGVGSVVNNCDLA